MPSDRSALAISAGDLRHMVSFYQRTVTKDETTGAEVVTYMTLYRRVPAEMDPSQGRKFFDASRFNVEVLDTIAIRYLYGLDETMRMTFGGRNFEILSVIDVQERRRKMLVALRELK